MKEEISKILETETKLHAAIDDIERWFDALDINLKPFNLLFKGYRGNLQAFKDRFKLSIAVKQIDDILSLCHNKKVRVLQLKNKPIYRVETIVDEASREKNA